MKTSIVIVAMLLLVIGTAMWHSLKLRGGEGSAFSSAEAVRSPSKVGVAIFLLAFGVLLLAKAQSFDGATSSVDSRLMEWLASMPTFVTSLAFGLAVAAVMTAVHFVVRLVNRLADRELHTK